MLFTMTCASARSLIDHVYYHLYQYGIITDIYCKQCQQLYKQQQLQLYQHQQVNDRVPSKRNEHISPSPNILSTGIQCSHNGNVVYKYNCEIAESFIDNNHNHKLDSIYAQQIYNLCSSIKSQHYLTQSILHHSLTHIDLSHCNITSMDRSILQMTNIKYLNLSNNRIRHIPQYITQLVCLAEFNISHNELTDIAVLSKIGLWQLDVSYNQIETIPNNLSMSIAQFNLSYNNIINLQDTLLSLQPLSNLTDLQLQYNPICLYKLYKYVVCGKLPQLTHLDTLRINNVTDDQLSILFSSVEPVVDSKGKSIDRGKRVTVSNAKLHKKQQDKLEEQAKLAEQQHNELIGKRRAHWLQYINSHLIYNESIQCNVELCDWIQLPPPPYINPHNTTMPNKTNKSARLQQPVEHTVVTTVDNVKTTVTSRSMYYIQYILNDVDTIHETNQLLHADALHYSMHHEYNQPSATLRNVLLLTGITFILKRATTTTTLIETTIPIDTTHNTPITPAGGGNKQHRRKTGTKAMNVPTTTTSNTTQNTLVDVLGTYTYETSKLLCNLLLSCDTHTIITHLDTKQTITFINADTSNAAPPQCTMRFVLNNTTIPSMEQLTADQQQYKTHTVAAITDKIEDVSLFESLTAPVIVG